MKTRINIWKNKQSSPPSSEVTVSSVAALKALSNPLRLSILEAIGCIPMTVKRLATILRQPQTKLYRHIQLLVRNGLAKVTETRVVSGIEEKHYQAAARAFSVDRKLLPRIANAEEARMDALLHSLLEVTRIEIRKAVQDGAIDLSAKPPEPRSLLALRGHLRLKPDQATALQQRLMDIIKRIGGCGLKFPDHIEGRISGKCRPGSNRSSSYAISLAFYPISKSKDRQVRKRRYDAQQR